MIRRDHSAYALGLQGPDLFFYYLPSYLMHRKNIGDLAHRKDTGQFFANLLQSRKLFAGKKHSLSIADAYICGFMGHYTPVIDAKSIPTGEIASVDGTPFDFREAKPMGRDIEQANDQLSYGHGYDHNFVLDKERAGLEKIATAYSTKSGIKMDVITDCIGMQLYTANFIQGQKVQGGAVCKERDAFCLETQYFPNSINEPNFTTPLTEAGKSYDTKTVYAF